MKQRVALAVLLFAMAIPASAQVTLYVGQVFTLAGTFCPSGSVPTDGRLLPISQYEPLFNLLTTRYGGDGLSNFAVPNIKPPLSANRAPLITCISLFGVYPSST